MTLVLQEPANCCHLLPTTQPANNLPFTPQTYEFQLYDPKGISHGCRSWYYLRPGISLLIEDYQLQEDLVIEIPSHPSCNYWEFGFSMSGYTSGIPIDSGQNFISLNLEFEENINEVAFKECQAQERILKLDIHIEYSLFESLILSYLDRLPSNFQDFVDKSNRDIDYLQLGRTTPQMQTILQQILNCPYQALTKQLYLEAKVLELMALRLEYLQDCQALSFNINLKPEQVDSIYQARDIIISNFCNPPSLLTLARQVNLNDCTLKKGFQQVFGTTVFGYLHNYRMEKAQELLLDTKLTVNQVAKSVGYASRSAFMTAFRKKFGTTPSLYSQNNSV